MDVRFGGFTLRADCPACGLPVPLNAPDQTAHCRSCSADFTVPPRAFSDLLLQFDNHHPEAAQPYPGGAQPVIDGMQVHATCVSGPPACEKCKTPFDLGSLPLDATTTFACASCGDAAVGFPAPPWLRALVETARFVVVTDASAAPGGDARVAIAGASHPIALPCTQCGAPLHVTPASERTVACEFCKTDVYLPDDLWRRLHPVKTMAPWFVRFEGESRTERAVAEAARARKEYDARKAEDAARRDEAAESARITREAEGQRSSRGFVYVLVIGVGLAALGVGTCIARRSPPPVPVKTATTGIQPEALARTSLDLTPRAMASQFSARLTDNYLTARHNVPPSGWDYPDHRCEATVCIEIRSDVYARVDVYWRDKNADHPSAFSIAVHNDGRGMDLDDAARRRISAVLPNGLDSWGHWYAFPDRDILLDKHAGARVRVAPDEEKNPEWRTQFDAAWKLVMGEVFKLSLPLSPDELRALAAPTANVQPKPSRPPPAPTQATPRSR